MDRSAAYWINTLQLTPHIEGGAYRQTYRSDLVIAQAHLSPAFHGPRAAATAIYFLLAEGQFSAMHRIASDEIWHFYDGDPLLIYEIDKHGHFTEHLLGNHPEHQENFQCVVAAGSWFGSAIKEGGQYALVGCTVSPGFDFADFELAERETLVKQYPQHQAIIERLTRQ